jgi:predicted aspartyl protease
MAQIERVSERCMKGAFCLLLWALPGLFMLNAHAVEQRTFDLEQDARNRPVMNITINGAPTTALLDTGATIGLVDDAFLTAPRDDSAAASNTLVLGIGGQRLYPIAALPSLTVGSTTWTDLDVAVNTENRFPVDHNILPISLFQTGIVDFEFQRSRVHFYDGRPRRVRGAQKSTVGYFENGRLIYIPIRINGVRGNALIDTGADMSFVNPAFARQSKAVRDLQASEEMRGADLKKNIAEIYTFRHLRFGENRVAKFKVPVLESELFSELGYGDTPMMVMGMDLLGHFRLQVDRDRRRITFVHESKSERRHEVRPQISRMNEILIH